MQSSSKRGSVQSDGLPARTPSMLEAQLPGQGVLAAHLRTAGVKARTQSSPTMARPRLSWATQSHSAVEVQELETEGSSSPGSKVSRLAPPKHNLHRLEMSPVRPEARRLDPIEVEKDSGERSKHLFGHGRRESYNAEHSIPEEKSESASSHMSQGARKHAAFDQDTAFFPWYGSNSLPQAPIWAKYVDEAGEWDKNAIEDWNAQLDVLLIFATLFSAILTAFLVVVYPTSLQGDKVQSTVDALAAISSQLADISAGSGRNSIPFQPPPIMTVSTPLLIVICLWFAGLIMSLTASLAVLVIKQWLRAYTKDLPSDPDARTRLRHFRYEGLRKWGVQGIIYALPLVINVSVLMFIVGLALLLQTVNLVVGWLTTALAIVSVTIYGVSIGLPLIFVECPYRSPVSMAFWHVVRHIMATSWVLSNPAQATKWAEDNARPRVTDDSLSLWKTIAIHLRINPTFATQEIREQHSIEERGYRLTTQAFSWITSTTTKEDLRDASVLAFVGWEPSSREWDQKQDLVCNAAEDAFQRQIRDVQLDTPSGDKLVGRLSELAGLCYIIGEGTSMPDSHTYHLFFETSIRAVPDSKLGTQRLHLLQCVVLLHMSSWWDSSAEDDAWMYESVRPLMIECVELLRNCDSLPVVATSLFLNVMSFGRLANMESRQKWADHSDIRGYLISTVCSLIRRDGIPPVLLRASFQFLWDVNKEVKSFMSIRSPTDDHDLRAIADLMPNDGALPFTKAAFLAHFEEEQPRERSTRLSIHSLHHSPLHLPSSHHSSARSSRRVASPPSRVAVLGSPSPQHFSAYLPSIPSIDTTAHRPPANSSLSVLPHQATNKRLIPVKLGDWIHGRAFSEPSLTQGRTVPSMVHAAPDGLGDPGVDHGVAGSSSTKAVPKKMSLIRNTSSESVSPTSSTSPPEMLSSETDLRQHEIRAPNGLDKSGQSSNGPTTVPFPCSSPLLESLPPSSVSLEEPQGRGTTYLGLTGLDDDRKSEKKIQGGQSSP